MGLMSIMKEETTMGTASWGNPENTLLLAWGLDVGDVLTNV
jgi:hypothetical protein